FFQAEDGIRDKLVTGVQTCALPILPAFADVLRFHVGHCALEDQLSVLHELVKGRRNDGCRACSAERECGGNGDEERTKCFHTARSEERRVGKECRCGWRREDEKENG